MLAFDYGTESQAAYYVEQGEPMFYFLTVLGMVVGLVLLSFGIMMLMREDLEGLIIGKLFLVGLAFAMVAVAAYVVDSDLYGFSVFAAGVAGGLMSYSYFASSTPLWKVHDGATPRRTRDAAVISIGIAFLLLGGLGFVIELVTDPLPDRILDPYERKLILQDHERYLLGFYFTAIAGFIVMLMGMYKTSPELFLVDVGSGEKKRRILPGALTAILGLLLFVGVAVYGSQAYSNENDSNENAMIGAVVLAGAIFGIVLVVAGLILVKGEVPFIKYKGKWVGDTENEK